MERLREVLEALGATSDAMDWRWPNTEPSDAVFHDWSVAHGFPWWA